MGPRTGGGGVCRRGRAGKFSAPLAVTVPMAALALLLLIAAPACRAPSDAAGSESPEPTAALAPNPDRDALVALYHATDGPNWKRKSNWLSEVPLGHWNLVHTNPNGRVTALSLKENRMRGEIPAQLGDTEYLEILALNGNELHGEIPAALGNLTNLVILLLDNNQLTGEIPPELGDLPKLSMVMLGGNQLTGCIPERLSYALTNDLDELGLPFCGTS